MKSSPIGRKWMLESGCTIYGETNSRLIIRRKGKRFKTQRNKIITSPRGCSNGERAHVTFTIYPRKQKRGRRRLERPSGEGVIPSIPKEKGGGGERKRRQPYP